MKMSQEPAAVTFNPFCCIVLWFQVEFRFPTLIHFCHAPWSEIRELCLEPKGAIEKEKSPSQQLGKPPGTPRKVGHTGVNQQAEHIRSELQAVSHGDPQPPVNVAI